MNKDISECWAVLPKVSRSFALAIKVLPKPLDRQMMVSYLIYRVIDTIEDSKATSGMKKELFDEFISSLSQKKMNAGECEGLREKMLAELDYTYEEELLAMLPTVVGAYYSLPKGVRESVLRWGRVMAQGMYEFQGKKIDTFEDQDRYSYYVAGVVGHLFNDLLYYNKIITLKTKEELHAHAEKFGLALQKVNILRDVASDIPSGRRYWPRIVIEKYDLDYESLLEKENREKAMKVLKEEIDDATQYLNSAMHYTLSLPKNALKVRMFCIIPLFMAAESYAKCAQNRDVFERGKKVKITRAQVWGIVAKATMWGCSNERLRAWFDSTVERARAQAAVENNSVAVAKVRAR